MTYEQKPASNEQPELEIVTEQSVTTVSYPPPPPLPVRTKVDYSKRFHPWDPQWWKHNFNIKTLSENRRTFVFCLLVIVARIVLAYYSKPQIPKQQSQPVRGAAKNNR